MGCVHPQPNNTLAKWYISSGMLHYSASLGCRPAARQVLTHKSLATFTLPDCVGTILGQTIEVGPGEGVGAL
jgi:hypothetical protein